VGIGALLLAITNVFNILLGACIEAAGSTTETSIIPDSFLEQ